MNPLPIFIVQLAWFLLAWSLIVYFVVWPWSQRLSVNARLSLWVAPQMFRVLGLGLLVPNLSPGMPREFAVATSIGDSLTAVLALLAFMALQRNWSAARTLAWACMLIGTIDLLIAFPHAARSNAAAHMTAQWYVPVFGGTLLGVSHVAGLITLFRTRRAAGPS